LVVVVATVAAAVEDSLMVLLGLPTPSAVVVLLLLLLLLLLMRLAAASSPSPSAFPSVSPSNQFPILLAGQYMAGFVAISTLPRSRFLFTFLVVQANPWPYFLLKSRSACLLLRALIGDGKLWEEKRPREGKEKDCLMEVVEFFLEKHMVK
jgi:hypothetical protein